jgi:hypothetical protein
MGTVPAPYSWTDGEIPDFREMEDRVADMLTFLMSPPMIRLRKTNAQNFTSGTETAIIWNFVELETENMWTSTTPTIIKPSTPGWYVGTFGASFAANATGYREYAIRKNGGSARTIRAKSQTYPSGQQIVRGHLFVESFNGTTDYIEATQWQNSGSTIANSVATVEEQPDIVLRWFAPL